MHQIAIPQRVIDRLVAMRGKLHLNDRLAGPRTALVVIDLQNVFMLPGMPVEVPAAREIVPNVNRLARAVRAAGGMVAWVQMTAESDHSRWRVFYDRLRTEERRQETVRRITRGDAGHALHAGLEVRGEDMLVEKTRYSAFIQGSSDIDARLRAHGIDTVVIVGTLTNVCCESSARDAMMLNFKVIMVSDALATHNDEEHNAALSIFYGLFGDVQTVDEAVQSLERGDKSRAAA